MEQSGRHVVLHQLLHFLKADSGLFAVADHFGQSGWRTRISTEEDSWTGMASAWAVIRLQWQQAPKGVSNFPQADFWPGTKSGSSVMRDAIASLNIRGVGLRCH